MAEGVAQAQDNVTKLAREKFLEGVTAFDAGRFEEARTLFLQAYALKRHPAVLLNLGQSELKSGHTEDGGNHLQQFLREHGEATPEQKEAAKAGISEAQQKTGFVIIIVDADGADLTIDGQPIGKSPLLDPYFVKPGKHQAAAQIGGKTVTGDFDAKRGGAVPVTLTTGMASAPAPVPAPVPDPGVTPMPSPNPEPPPPAGYPPPMGQQPPPGQGPSFGGPMMPPPDRGERKSFPDWYVDSPMAWVFTGVAGAGLIGTIVSAGVAGSADGNADSIAQQIRDEQARNTSPTDAGFTGGRAPCGDPSLDNPAAADLAHYTDACNSLRDKLSQRKSALIAMGVMIGVTVVGAAGVVAFYFVESGDGGSAKKERERGPSFSLAPILSPQEQGIGVVGTF